MRSLLGLMREGDSPTSMFSIAIFSIEEMHAHAINTHAHANTETTTQHKNATDRLIMHMQHNMCEKGLFNLHQTKNRGAGGMATSPHLSRARRKL